MAIDFQRGPRWYAAGSVAVAIVFVLWRVWAGGPSYIVQIDFQWTADFVTGAEVVIDDAVVGTLEPIGRRMVNGFAVEKGPHSVTLRTDKCLVEKEQVTLGPGRYAILTSDFEDRMSAGTMGCYVFFR